MSKGPDLQGGFGHVGTWVFDLDNTLYPADCNLFAQIDRRMSEFIATSFSIPLADAQVLRETYYYEHGTTLAGLMRLHDICPNSFLDYVHDIDLSGVEAAPHLGAAIDALPGRKFIFTNGSRKHAEAVSARLGLLDHFEDIFDIHALEYIYPKPMREAYERFIKTHGIAAAGAAMFDDLPHNLETAHHLGMTTVLVDCAPTEHPEHQAIAGWAELPQHIHHLTDALAPFLGAIAASFENGPCHLHSPPPSGGRIEKGVQSRRSSHPHRLCLPQSVLPLKGGARSKSPLSAISPEPSESIEPAMTYDHLKTFIESAFDHAHEITPETKGVVRDAVDEALTLLDQGELRVAEKVDGNWLVNQWLKKAILLSFRLHDPHKIEGAPEGGSWWDKVPTKFADWKAKDFKEAGFRVVPGAVVRRSAYIAPGAVLMPCFVNLGARVDTGAMIDTWATVGSCAQIGKNVHLSGGAGIGGVLEPLQANPVIIEDNCFIGARAEVAEGVIVGEGSVLSMGVYLGQSTKIINRMTGEVLYGRVPPYSVVVSGAMPGKPLPAGSPGPSLYCAVIVKTVDERTRAKTSINELLRD